MLGWGERTEHFTLANTVCVFEGREQDKVFVMKHTCSKTMTELDVLKY